MPLRSLSCAREVGLNYPIPLRAESKLSEKYADPKDVMVVGFFVNKARDTLKEKYRGIVEIDVQLDPRIGLDNLDRNEIQGYYFSVGISRVNPKITSKETLEKAVSEFIDIIPLKPIPGSAPSNIYNMIKNKQIPVETSS